MFERECRIYAYLLHHAGRLIGPIDDDDFARQPAPGVNHPAWLLGHLAVATDYGLRCLGRPGALPESWHRDFGSGSAPSPDRGGYPGKRELWDAYWEGHERFARLAPDANPEAMKAPQPLDFLRPGLVDVGDLVAHLLTSHEAMHLGHLSNWRRQVGLPPLF